MTDTLQQVADDLASHIGEMRVVMDEMARALKPFAIEGHAWQHELASRGDCRIRIGRNDINEHFATGILMSDFRSARSALSAYERVRKLYSIETAPTEVRKQAGDVS